MKDWLTPWKTWTEDKNQLLNFARSANTYKGTISDCSKSIQNYFLKSFYNVY